MGIHIQVNNCEYDGILHKNILPNIIINEDEYLFCEVWHGVHGSLSRNENFAPNNVDIKSWQPILLSVMLTCIYWP